MDTPFEGTIDLAVSRNLNHVELSFRVHEGEEPWLWRAVELPPEYAHAIGNQLSKLAHEIFAERN